jgi:LmbE family N-acetylglucosaminyl deacetylase
MTDLHPDHLRLLSLARAAIEAQDNRQLWQRNTLAAAEAHGAACEMVWDELNRQIALQDNRVPVAEMPSVTKQKMAARMRSEIVNTALAAIEEAMDELANGPWMEDFD